MADFGCIIGKIIASIVLNKTVDVVTFTFSDGTTKRYSTEGDCCSSSWIEHLEMPNDVAGATIMSVEDSGEIANPNRPGANEGTDCLAVYNTRFRTSRGDVVLEYRNDSNGYYGGWLTDA